MQARLSFSTPGVSDLERTKRFSNDMRGWKPFQDIGGIVMYKLNGMILPLFGQRELMEDTRVKNTSLGPCEGGKPSAPHFTLAQCPRSPEEVDALFAELGKHGVTITKDPEKVFWGGYSGYFADPDGHL